MPKAIGLRLAGKQTSPTLWTALSNVLHKGVQAATQAHSLGTPQQANWQARSFLCGIEAEL